MYVHCKFDIHSYMYPRFNPYFGRHAEQGKGNVVGYLSECGGFTPFGFNLPYCMGVF